MPKIVKLGSILFVITAVTGLLLGAVQNVTSGSIAAQRARQKNDALAATLPGAKNFTPVALKADAGIISEVYAGSAGGATIGYNFTLTPKAARTEILDSRLRIREATVGFIPFCPTICRVYATPQDIMPA